MLGAGPKAFAIGRKTYELGFPLRAALRLARKYPDLTQLLHDLGELRLEALAQVITECSGDRISAEQLFDDLDPQNRGTQLRIIAGTLMEHVIALFSDGLDLDAKPSDKPAKSHDKLDLAAGYENLFKRAGAIGWTPETIWNASPSEILAATNAADERHWQSLKFLARASGATFDDEDNDKPAFDAGHFDREGLQSLKGMGTWQ